MDFCHLHVHTEYSLLDGSNKLKDYVKRVKELGMNSAAITDHGVMYGVYDFYHLAIAEGIKPIIGCEIYVAPGSRFDKEAGGEERYHHLILLAENDEGYSNLCKIVSIGHTEGFYYKPRVDKEVLRKYSKGLICCSACIAGEVARDILKDDYELAKSVALEYQEIFGKGNFFLELQDHGMPEQRKVNTSLIRMHNETGIELVATNDVHYTYADDVESHDLLLCIQTGKLVTDEDRMRYEGGQFYIKSPEEMAALFPYAPEAIANTQKIADRCNVTIKTHQNYLPHFPVPDGYDSKGYLRYLCEKGLKERYSNIDEKYDGEMSYKERLDYELGVIETMGFVDYFLIVWDFINYARSKDIPVGPGRGSAAGSIVAYSLHITNIDPIKYNLLFERFLNPERVTMPDIDIDFCYERRQEVIDYVSAKYGAEKVVQIVTFGTLAAKGVIRDVGRVLDLPYSFCDQISKMIPNELNITLAKALEMNEKLKDMYDTDPQVKYLIDMAQKLEGLPRHTSMHAAGVVICPDAADNFVPLSRGSDGSVTTEYVMTALEEIGLLKMDFLGLRTLTVLHDAVLNVKNTTGKVIDLDHIDYDDKNVYQYISTGKTEGIFQLESGGMKNFMRELKPTCLEDVIAGVSLYRPGPMEFIPKYVKGKHDGLDKVTYVCEELRPILEPTYGCIVYQEQVMQIVRDLGGYTLGRSDLVRRAMSKKKAYVIEAEKKNFVYGNEEEGVPGCISRGISEAAANEVYDSMMDFAKYAFNKSHAACYAVVAYQTAYMKYYYPAEFMASLMTSFIENASKVSEYMGVCREMGLEILPPDVNEGDAFFNVANGKIRYTLTAIKGVGLKVIEGIVNERRRGGTFRSFNDFLERMADKDLNKRAIENFIKAGAFDSLNPNRRSLMMGYEEILKQITKGSKDKIEGQMSFFDFLGEEDKQEYEAKLPDVSDYEKEMKLAFEKEVLGIYVSGHPLEDYEEMLTRHISAKTSDFMLDPETGTSKITDGLIYTVGGIISDKKIKFTKNNKQMAILTLEDMVGSIEVIIFQKAFEKCEYKLNDDEKIFVRGRASAEDEKDAKLIADEVLTFLEVNEGKDFFSRNFERTDGYRREVVKEAPAQKAGAGKLPRGIWIQFENDETLKPGEEKLPGIAAKFPGDVPLVLYRRTPKGFKFPEGNLSIANNSESIEYLKEIFGEENVKILL